ncbi:hypothetical protein IC582_012862 [Cucumis melo]
MKLSSLLLLFSFLLAAINFSAADGFDVALPPSYPTEPPVGDPWSGLRVFDVSDYGAVADGKTNDTLVIPFPLGSFFFFFLILFLFFIFIFNYVINL